MSTINVNGNGYPSPDTGGSASGSGPGGVVAGGDVPSALQVVLSALQSSAGIARLTTQTGTPSEVAALAKLTGVSTQLGAHAAAVATNAGIAAITGTSTYGNLVTAIAAS